MEEKKQFWQRPEDSEGFGQAFVVSAWEPETWLVRHVPLDHTPKTFEEATSIPQAFSTIKVIFCFFRYIVRL